MRLFIAADLTDEARRAVAAEQKRIASALDYKQREPLPAHRSAAALRWVNADHAHLTLIFLGDVEEPRVPAVAEVVGRHIDAAPFEITLERIGVFPARGAPRVLWIGVGDGASRLSELQRELARRIATLGIELEHRPFHPHLTLARWRESRSADRERALSAAPRGLVARARIDGATLYQSRLSPAGPSYTALARANLISR
jgi:2'-5' RNA ligase